MIHIDIFGLCVPNNLHAVLSTIRNVEVVLDAEKAAYLNAKSKVIVTKYNDARGSRTLCLRRSAWAKCGQRT
ncbi:hypothetical protein HMSSN036_27000 [Paenibacillus macerans]|nr:hypothetical protein HMSSN036_27000 [Paenibacillus macerans]